MTNQIKIYEKFNNVSTLEKTTNDGFMRLSGVFGVCGVRNNNHRVYEASNYRKMVEQLQERIKGDGVPGQLEHPDTMNIELDNISHVIEKIDMDDKGVISGTIKLLNTPKGLLAQKLVEGGLPLFISSRAVGTIDKSGNVTLENIQTYDLVGTPGFSQAKLHLNENYVCESIDDNMYYIMEKQGKQNNEDKTMTNEELVQKVEDLQKLVESQSEEINALKESRSNMDITELLENIQNWAIDELCPQIQNWIIEQYSPEVEKWITEQYSECVEKWVTEEFAGKIDEWMENEHDTSIKESIMNEVRNFAVTELAEGIQEWFINEASPVIESWSKEELAKQITEGLQPKQDKQSLLESIDSALQHIDQNPTKPIVQRIVESGDGNEPLFIRNMPEEVRPKYEACNEEQKAYISRKARMYELNTEEQITRFWENVSFEKQSTIMESAHDVNPSVASLRSRIRRYHNR